MSKLQFFKKELNFFGLKGVNNQIYRKGFLRGAVESQVYSIDTETSFFNTSEDVKISFLTRDINKKDDIKYIEKGYREAQKVKASFISLIENSNSQLQVKSKNHEKFSYLGQLIKLKKKIYKGSLDWQKTKPCLYSRNIIKSQFSLLDNFYCILKILRKSRKANTNFVLKSALILKEQRGGFLLFYFGIFGFMPINHFNVLSLYYFSTAVFDLSYNSFFNFFKSNNIFRIYFYNFDISKKLCLVKNSLKRTNSRKKNKKFFIELNNWDKIWNKKRRKNLRRKEKKTFLLKEYRFKFYVVFFIEKHLLFFNRNVLKYNNTLFSTKKLSTNFFDFLKNN